MQHRHDGTGLLESAITNTLFDVLGVVLERGEHAIAADVAAQLADLLRSPGSQPSSPPVLASDAE